MHERTKRLKQLKAKYGLTHKHIAAILHVQPHTALVWQMTKEKRVIPIRRLKRLEEKLGINNEVMV